ncbi:MAG: RDD family protein [Planctomycetota bacterium]
MIVERRQLDNTIEIVTPENIAFQYQLAGPFRRAPAYLFDFGIRIAISAATWFLLVVVFGAVGLAEVGFGLVLVCWFLLAWFYGGFFETFWNGQTPGKRMMRLRVLSVDGQPVNGLQAVLRNVLRTVDQQPMFFCLVGLASSSANDRFQRLGDLACGTMVVVDEPHWFGGIVRIEHPEAIRLAGQIPASFQAGRSTSRALASYVRRRKQFSPARRMEIARLLGEPLRKKLNLPHDTNPDLLLCGLYRRTFITDRGEEPGLQNGTSLFQMPSLSAASGAAKPETVEMTLADEGGETT